MADTIIFERIDGGDTETPLPEARGAAAVVVHGFGWGGIDGGVGLARIRLRAADGAAPAPPAFAIGDAAIPLVQAYSYGPAVYAPGVGDAAVPITGHGYATAHFGAGAIRVRGFGLGHTDDDVQPPPVFADTVEAIYDVLALQTAGAQQETAVCNDTLAVTSRRASKGVFHNAQADDLAFADRLSAVYRMLVEESLSFGTALSGRAIAVVIDRLRLAGEVASWAEGVAAVTSALAFEVLADIRAKEQITDTLALNAAAAAVYTAMERLVDDLLLAETVGGGARLSVALTDALALSIAANSSGQAVAAIRDGLAFALHLDLDDGRYTAAVINTLSKGTSSYTHYPFNSFGRFAGRYYGMAPDGLRRLEGDTDDGAPINARIRLAFTNLGAMQQKRMQAAYLAYTASGELRLKVIVAGADGQKEAHCYRLREQPAEVPTNARIQIGQGLKTAHWGFELEAIDGAAFYLDALELVPIMLEQKMNGQGGGLY